MSLDSLLGRVSTPARKLLPPGPSDMEITQIIDAGCRAPDHAALRPWRFIVIPPKHRDSLADIFAALAPEQPDRAREKALNAPCLMAVVASLVEHPSVPYREQYASLGAAIGFMLLAADQMGFGAIFLSGKRCADRRLCDALYLTPTEELMGFLSVGTLHEAKIPKTRPTASEVTTYWEP